MFTNLQARYFTSELIALKWLYLIWNVSVL